MYDHPTQEMYKTIAGWGFVKIFVLNLACNFKTLCILYIILHVVRFPNVGLLEIKGFEVVISLTFLR